jgi:hypothetical protein
MTGGGGRTGPTETDQLTPDTRSVGANARERMIDFNHIEFTSGLHSTNHFITFPIFLAAG